MYEHLVKNVRQHGSSKDFVHLQWESADGKRIGDSCFSVADIGAIETWLAQPKPPTARERAASIFTDWYNDRSVPSLPVKDQERLITAVAAAIEAAENAAREAGE